MKPPALPQPVVTATGAVSALGIDWPTTWDGLLSSALPRTSYQAIDRRYGLDVTVAAVPGLNRSLSESGEGATVRLANMALRQVRSSDEPLRVYGGSNHGETDVLLTLLADHAAPGTTGQWRAVLFDPVPRACGQYVEWACGACTSGLLALAAAVEDSAQAEGDLIVLAADALSGVGIIGFRRISAISGLRSRPFHLTRDGLLIGEGAVALRLSVGEPEPGAIQILGLGLSCDAGHPTDPAPDGRWLGRALDDALRRAELVPSEIQAIVCHGTGTLKNDAVEAAVIAERWSRRSVPITSVKGTLGHTMGAAGLFNVLVAAEACRTGRLPPTFTDGSETIDQVDVVCGGPRDIELGGPVLVLASGFGGNNSACIVGAHR
jgi:3-oxoacyl-[acyl-carrier-protein] synthase II